MQNPFEGFILIFLKFKIWLFLNKFANDMKDALKLTINSFLR